jgi:hypothetical protein
MRHVVEDVNTAAFLVTKGCACEGVERLSGKHFGFVFSDPRSPALSQEFYNHGECDALKFSGALRDLKDMIYQIRNEVLNYDRPAYGKVRS